MRCRETTRLIYRHSSSLPLLTEGRASSLSGSWSCFLRSFCLAPIVSSFCDVSCNFSLPLLTSACSSFQLQLTFSYLLHWSAPLLCHAHAFVLVLLCLLLPVASVGIPSVFAATSYPLVPFQAQLFSAILLLFDVAVRPDTHSIQYKPFL